MFIDTRQISQDKSLIATVCIIGGGVAGISIARELEKQGIDTCLPRSSQFFTVHSWLSERVI